METNTLDNQSRSERFELIKAECRSQVKLRLWIFAAALLIPLFLFIAVVVVAQNRLRLTPLCLALVYGVSFLWSIVIDYRFLKRLDNLDTPEELLHCFEKKLSNQRNPAYLAILGLVGLIIDSFEWEWVTLAFAAVVVAFLIYSYFKGDYVQYKSSRDDEILSRLEDLVENK